MAIFHRASLSSVACAGRTTLSSTASAAPNTLWVAVNNRDQLPYPFRDSTGSYGQVFWSYVDNHPPDLFTAVRDGGNYGWPFCDSNPDKGLDRMPFDPDYDTNLDGHVDCG